MPTSYQTIIDDYNRMFGTGSRPTISGHITTILNEPDEEAPEREMEPLDLLLVVRDVPHRFRRQNSTRFMDKNLQVSRLVTDLQPHKPILGEKEIR